MKNRFVWRLVLSIALTFFFDRALAQSSEIANYITPISNICLGIGALVGIVGGIRVYYKWVSSEQDITAEAWGWGAACVFLVLTSIAVRAFMGY